MSRFITILVAVLLFLPLSKVSAQSFTESQLGETDRQAYTLLLHAERFESVAIGAGGKLSDLVKAYRFLLKGPSADQAFKSLLEKATLAGQLYALCGLYFTDPEYFRTAVEKYRHNDEVVPILFACELGVRRVSWLVESKHKNAVRLDYREQSIFEWVEKHNLHPFDFDIIGGGYPSWFRDKRP